MGDPRRHADEERFGDLVYEAWCRGRDPDLLSRDRYADARANGQEPEEIMLDDVSPPSRASEVPDEA